MTEIEMLIFEKHREVTDYHRKYSRWLMLFTQDVPTLVRQSYKRNWERFVSRY